MRHLMTLACLIAAVAFYVAGHRTGAAVLVAVGVCAELAFWYRLNRALKSRSADAAAKTP